MTGLHGNFGQTNYGAAKAAVNHLTVCVAMQLGEKNVRVNSISPGGIATGIFAKALGLPPDQVGAGQGLPGLGCFGDAFDGGHVVSPCEIRCVDSVR